ADGQDQRLRDQVRLQADEQRVAGDPVAELRDEALRRNAQEDGREREEQEREGQSQRQPEQGREEPAHGRPKPAARSFARPVEPSTRRTKARAAAWCSAARTTASS